MSQPIFTAQDVTMRFGGVVAVDGLNLSVEAGRIHAVIGPNGAGKSTLFNCISGFYKPSAGRITFDGHELGRYKRHQIPALGIARSFQNLELFKGLSVYDNIRMGLFTRGLSNTDERDEVEAILTDLGLQDLAQELAGNLDFGTQKMIEIGRALALRPRLMLLDEPAAGLRNHSIRKLEGILRDLSKQGITIILVEHVMALVMAVSDRITVMNFGKMITEGSPEEVRSNPEVIKAYLGSGRNHA